MRGPPENHYLKVVAVGYEASNKTLTSKSIGEKCDATLFWGLIMSRVVAYFFVMNTLTQLSIGLILCSTLLSAKPMALKKFPNKRFDSAHAVVLDVQLTEGILETEEDNNQMMQEELTTQLFYLVGAMNAYNGTPDLAHVQLEIKKIEPIPGTRSKKVSFGAKFHVGWPREMSSPAVMSLPLPIRSDEKGLNAFFRKYAKNCSEDGSDNEVGSFYYYYRPNRQGCELNSNPKAENATFVNLKFGISPENTQGKSPEYGKIWEDGKAVITIIIGTDQPGAHGNNDAGIWQYNSFYQTLWRTFGQPYQANVNLGPKGMPGKRFPDVEMTWRSSTGKEININLLLVDKMGLLNPTKEFIARYNQRTEISDFVSYNGHSGFGDNIKALAKLGDFRKGQYQIYYINGCDTFAYVDDALSDAHMEVNPGEGRYRYFDIITNTMPSPFNGFIITNMSVIQGMLGMRDTYHTILSRFDSYQRAVVMGEEDNKWPNPF